MKYKLIALWLVGVLMVACNSDSVEDEVKKPDNVEDGFIPLDSADMQLISLIEFDLNLDIQLPIVANASGKIIEPVVSHDDGDYLWYIEIGEYFNIVIEDYAKEFNKVLEAKKRNQTQSNMFIFNYLIDEQNIIFYSRQLLDENGGVISYHCLREIEIDGYNYILRTEKTGSNYKSVAQDMVSSIQTAKPVN